MGWQCVVSLINGMESDSGWGLAVWQVMAACGRADEGEEEQPRVARVEMPVQTQETPVSKSFKDWLSEGESIYEAALKEFQSLEAQLADLEAQLVEKREEVNAIAAVIGKPPVESSPRRAAVEIVDGHGPGSIPNARNTIAKALTGRGLG